jgi:hypothetical protein
MYQHTRPGPTCLPARSSRSSSRPEDLQAARFKASLVEQATGREDIRLIDLDELDRGLQ